MDIQAAVDDGFPEIDTSDLEDGLFDSDLERFQRDRPQFIALIYRLIAELNLQGKIEYLGVCYQQRGRAELWRKGGDPWPSKRLYLDIYPDRYMDEKLLRHELGHEADRHNPDMRYDPAMEKRAAEQYGWAFDLAANISLDARLGDRGLGEERRLREFHEKVGLAHDGLFEDAWANPPRSWPEIEDLARRLQDYSPEDRRQG